MYRAAVEVGRLLGEAGFAIITEPFLASHPTMAPTETSPSSKRGKGQAKIAEGSQARKGTIHR